MKIIQFTDPHIGGLDQDAHGIDTRTNFVNTLQAIRKEQADVVVLSGDLCFKEPRREVYEWIKARLDEYSIQPLLLTGNHDDTALMCEVMELENEDGELYYRRSWEGAVVLFLDTSKAIMSNRQWDWFVKQIDTTERVIIFTHYPPIMSYVPYMDNKHNFKQSERFLEAISSCRCHIHLFCGHYHVDKTISRGRLNVHITPSGFFQIRDDVEDFGIDHYRVGYRVIHLDPEVLAHRVRYL